MQGNTGHLVFSIETHGAGLFWLGNFVLTMRERGGMFLSDRGLRVHVHFRCFIWHLLLLEQLILEMKRGPLVICHILYVEL